MKRIYSKLRTWFMLNVFRFYNFAVDESYTFYSVRIFRMSVCAKYKDDKCGWLRIFGVGAKWKDSTKTKLLFSERIGKSRYIKVNKWIIGFLPYHGL